MLDSPAIIPPTRTGRVASAFLRIAFARALSYPLSLAMSEFAALIPMFIYFFVARLIDADTAAVGGDYFTFVVIGITVHHVLGASLKGFSYELELAINQGRFEILLVEPIADRAIPFGLIQWQVAVRFVAATVVVAVSLALGASYVLTGFIYAMGLLVLGVLATLSIGILAGSVRILAKQADPVITFYSFAVQIFSGVFFPVDALPPFLRWIPYLIPNTYVLDGFRKVLMPGGAGLPGFTPVSATIGLVLFCVIALPISLWAWSLALRLGRRIGALGGY